jgi:soluble lytic murein transglycosylase-like protein
VNTSFVTEFRRTVSLKIAAVVSQKNSTRPFSVHALRCAKGLTLAVLIGLAGSVATNIAVPHDGASAATPTSKNLANATRGGKLGKVSLSPKHVAAAKSAKSSNGAKVKTSVRARSIRPKVSPELVKLAASAVKATSSQTVRQSRKQTVKQTGKRTGNQVAKQTVKTRSLDRSGVTEVKSSKARTAQDASKSYRVRAGDSLSSIAVVKNTSVAALAQTNQLKPTSTLRVGQVLSLPKVELHGAKSLPLRLRANPKRLAVRKHTAKWAKANDIPQDLLEATLWQESGFDQTKVSSTGAIGVGQIMPDTASFIETELIGVELNPRVTEHNVRMSARYLRYLLKLNHSNTTKALHAYYQGMSSISENGLFDDTVKYARNVQALRRHFKER